VGCLISHCARLSHPPTHWHAARLSSPKSETCHLPCEGLPISYAFIGGSGQGCPLLRASNDQRFTIDPSKLACLPPLGRAPMLVNVRPSNEALLRARVPGAQDQRGCPSHPFHRARSVSKKGTWPLPSHPSQGARSGSKESSARHCTTPSKLARSLSGMGTD
jgi:hypothetical protein